MLLIHKKLIKSPQRVIEFEIEKYFQIVGPIIYENFVKKQRYTV